MVASDQNLLGLDLINIQSTIKTSYRNHRPYSLGVISMLVKKNVSKGIGRKLKGKGNYAMSLIFLLPSEHLPPSYGGILMEIEGEKASGWGWSRGAITKSFRGTCMRRSYFERSHI